MKRLFAWVFRWSLVYTKDYDGEVRLRRALTDPFGEITVRGVLWAGGILKKDGSISGGSYLRRWIPANKRGANLFPALPSEPTEKGS